MEDGHACRHSWQSPCCDLFVEVLLVRNFALWHVPRLGEVFLCINVWPLGLRLQPRREHPVTGTRVTVSTQSFTYIKRLSVDFMKRPRQKRMPLGLLCWIKLAQERMSRRRNLLSFCLSATCHSLLAPGAAASVRLLFRMATTTCPTFYPSLEEFQGRALRGSWLDRGSEIFPSPKRRTPTPSFGSSGYGQIRRKNRAKSEASWDM